MAGQRFNSGQVSGWGTNAATRPRTSRPSFGGTYQINTRHNSVMTMTLDRLYLIPVEFIPDYGYTEVGINVTTVGGTGRVVRIGIYECGPENVPGNLIIDAGTVSVETTGLKIATFSAPKIPAAIGFIGAVMQGGSGASCAINSANNNSTVSATGLHSSNSEAQGGWGVDSISGALPSSLASSTFANIGHPNPVMVYR